MLRMRSAHQESLVLGQFVVQQVLGEVKAQLGGGSLMAGGLK
ncbi:hypothetical protein HaLaN_16003, partial [Haematococcus lacustris]